MIDVHCHILPGLDDGPKTMEGSLQMCAIAQADGVQTIVATPHMLNGLYKVKREDILAGVQELNQACGKQDIDITILPGADIRVDHELGQLLTAGKVMTVADAGQHLMIELPEETVPAELQGLLFELQLMGTTPVISHPERNYAIQQNLGLLRKLVEAGNLTQITAGSLTGKFGQLVQQCSRKIVQAGLAHLLASDAHGSKRRRPELSDAHKVLEELVGTEEAKQMTHTRAALMVKGKYVSVPEPRAPAKKGFFSFLAPSKARMGG